MKATLLALALLMLGARSDDEDYRVQHCRPSKLIAKLAPLLSSLPDAGVEADDLKGLLHLHGTEDGIAQLKKLVEMMDVKPMDLEIKWRVTHEIDKLDLKGSATVPNNAAFEFGDSETRTRASARARILVGGKDAPPGLRIAFNFDLEIAGAKFRKFMEVKPGSQFVLKVPELDPSGPGSAQIQKDVNPREWPEFTMSVAIIEPKVKQRTGRSAKG